MSAGSDAAQNIALIAIFIASMSTLISRLLIGVMSANGLLNRMDIFILVILGWVFAHIGLTLVIKILDICEAKQPHWIDYFRSIRYIVNLSAGVFLSIYLNTFVELIDFKAFSMPEIFILVVGAILLLALTHKLFVYIADLDDHRPRPHKIAASSIRVEKNLDTIESPSSNHRSSPQSPYPRQLLFDTEVPRYHHYQQ